MSLDLSKHFDKNNPHHAYLIEGKRESVLLEILKFLKSLGVETTGNPDFININLDTFKIDDARNLKSYGAEKSFTGGKKIFIISANSFLLEAQNGLLKMFEEPIPDSHFFIIVPDSNTLLKTFVSRFYFIKEKGDSRSESLGVEKFLVAPLKSRVDFIKELLTEAESEDEEGNEILVLESSRAKAIKFLNELETLLHRKVFTEKREKADTDFFQHVFKVREYLRMPGSSAKSLMESVAIVVPQFSK
ncbi:MAG: hypothetical protein ACREGC_00395 [Minisyncoccia bacterium]